MLLELAFFAFAAWALVQTQRPSLGAWFAAAIVVHYAWAYDRIAWLLAR